MPTSGEALLARKNKTEEKSRSLKSKKLPTTTSRLPVAKNKRTLNRGKENTEPNKPHKAKPAPDFSKLHNKWNSQFQKGKAVAKKTNTKAKPFVLTENNKNSKSFKPAEEVQQSIGKKVKHDVEHTVPENDQDREDDFEIDPSALQGILSNTGIEVQETNKPHQRATIAATQQSSQNQVIGYPAKRASIYYTGTKENTRPNQQIKPQTHLNSNVDDEISFKPDAMALESILNNKGIDNRSLSRHTMASTRTMAFTKRQSIFEDNKQSKRTSIYYNGNRTTETTRLSMIGQSTAASNHTAANNKYTVGSTLVGFHSDKDFKDNKVDDEISFKPDATALESILNNKGIDNRSLSRHTMASTRTMAFTKRLSIFDDNMHEKRTSIYYTGSKTSRLTNEFSRQSILSSKSSQTVPTPSKTNSTNTLQQANTNPTLLLPNSTNSVSIQPTNIQTPSRSNTTIPPPTKTDQTCSTISQPHNTNHTPFKQNLIIPSSSKPNETIPLSLKPSHTSRVSTLKPQYSVGSTLVGYQDSTPFKQAKDDDAFTKPLLPERRKEPPDQELKPSISIALTTPSRGQLETKIQQSARSKKQVTWSEILTPHRDQQPLIAHKGGSILRMPGNFSTKRKDPTIFEDAPLDVNQSPTLNSVPIAMKLFSDDDTTTTLDREQWQLKELERQAMQDLELLDLEQTSPSQLNNNIEAGLRTPSIDISGCVPLTSPPDVVCTPSAHNNAWKVPIVSKAREAADQLISATPENHVRVTVRRGTPQNSNFAGNEHRQFTQHTRRLADFPAPTPIKTPVRVPVAFGLLSSIKKDNASKHKATRLQQPLSSTDTFYSSTPGIDITALWSEPYLCDENYCDSFNKHLIKSKGQLDLKNDNLIKSNQFNQERNNFRSGVDFTDKNSQNLLKRNRTEICSNDPSYSTNNTMESLSLRSSLKPKVRRVQCVTPVVNARSSSSELASIKNVVPPSSSLTEQALLDAEVTLYSTLGKRMKTPCHRNLLNPLTKLFDHGDSQHVVPVCLCTETINCPVHPAMHPSTHDWSKPVVIASQ